jgi:hypothetical protein
VASLQAGRTLNRVVSNDVSQHADLSHICVTSWLAYPRAFLNDDNLSWLGVARKQGVVMRFVVAAACVAAGLSSGTAALADSPAVAALQQPIAKPIQFISNAAIWDCEGSTCTAANAQDMYFGPSECHEVAKRAGPVGEFKNASKTLQQTALDRCNAGLSPLHGSRASH